jgi:hypothetical protein
MNLKFLKFKFQMRCKGLREMRREGKTLQVVCKPVLSHWANLCRAYGAEFILALCYSLCRLLSGNIWRRKERMRPIAEQWWILGCVRWAQAGMPVLLKAKCGRRNFKFENLRFQMRCEGSRERRRGRKTLRVVWDPVLPALG